LEEIQGHSFGLQDGSPVSFDLEETVSVPCPFPILAMDGQDEGCIHSLKGSHGSGKTVLTDLVSEGGDPAMIVEREGLAQISDSGELEAIVSAAIDSNPQAADQVRSGNEKAIGAIVGAVMKETKGRADGGEVNRLIRAQLGT